MLWTIGFCEIEELHSIVNAFIDLAISEWNDDTYVISIYDFCLFVWRFFCCCCGFALLNWIDFNCCFVSYLNCLLKSVFFFVFFAGSIRTSFLSGSTFNVTWHLAYPHRVSVSKKNEIFMLIWWMVGIFVFCFSLFSTLGEKYWFYLVFCFYWILINLRRQTFHGWLRVQFMIHKLKTGN